MNYQPYFKDVSYYVKLAGSPETNSLLNKEIAGYYSGMAEQNYLPPFIITDHSNISPVYASRGLAEIIGYTAGESEDNILLFYQGIHPDDKRKLYSAHKYLFRFDLGLSATENNFCRYSVNCRYCTKNGNYVWLLHDIRFIAHDHAGRPLISVVFITDITHLKNDNKVVLKIIKSENSGSIPITFTKVYSGIYAASEFTPREAEIVDMIGKGYFTKEIADKLGISVFTVNTHRQNILRKTESKTFNELIARLHN